MAQTMKSIERALEVLEVFLNKGRELTLTEVADLTGQNRPTAYRTIAPLVAYGYLYQKEKRGKYTLGTKWLDFATILKSTMEVSKVADSFLAALCEEINETVLLSSHQNSSIIFARIIHSSHLVKVEPVGNTAGEYYSTATGKIYLANLSKVDLHAYLGSIKLNPLTYNTVTDPGQLETELSTIRRNNVAYDNEEANLDVRGIASGIFDHEGANIGSVCAVGPANRLTRERVSTVAPIVRRCALDISRQLGFKGGLKWA
jgi:IclR family KDG regulon transcriptional repressor